jgi:hypothetical protein
VRAAIDERLNRLRSDLATRAIGRRLADLRGSFEQIAAEEAERALADEFSNLDPAQRELLQRFASTVARRLAHLPLAGMRAAAAHASTDAVDAFFREAKLRRSANGDSSGRWKTDPDALDATGIQNVLDEDELDVRGGRWKPDPGAVDPVGSRWKLGDVVSPQGTLGVKPADVARWPATNGAGISPTVPNGARQGKRDAEASNAGSVAAHAAPIRTSWAKD